MHVSVGLRFSGPNYDGLPAIVKNSIFHESDYENINLHWGNNGNTQVEISHCLIEGGIESITQQDDQSIIIWGEGNFDVDPRFIDAENNNYNLFASSRLINAGDPNLTDSDGSRSDIGAYPYLNVYEGEAGWSVSTDTGDDIIGTGDPNGIPFATIQAGLNFARNDQTVNVENGTYYELGGDVFTNNAGQEELVHVVWPDSTYKKGVQLLGEDSENTIIDGNNNGMVMLIRDVDATSLISGFTIQNGLALEGGAMMINYSGLSFEDLRIIDNEATNKGGGMCFIGAGLSDPHINNTLISNNSAIAGGGIVSYNGVHPIFENVTITGNQADDVFGGGGISFWYGGELTLVNSIVWDNTPYNIKLTEK